MHPRSSSSSAAPRVALLLCVTACGGPGDARGVSETVGITGASPGTGTTETGTTIPTTGDASASEGMGSTPTTTDIGTTQTPDDGTSTSTGAVAETSSSGDDSTTGAPCVPTPEQCNDLDDDCNDIVDDVDVGGDGICDCLDIALFGTKGGNPAAEFELWLEAQGTQVDRIQLDDTPITAQIVGDYDIIILDRLVRPYSPEEATVMREWVHAGGGLMAMTGYTGQPADVDHPNSLLAPMGLAFNDSIGIIDGPVTQWTPHPVAVDISSVTFLGGFYIDVTEDGIGANTIVASLPPGPVAVAQVRMAGKLFVWGDEWIEYDSEWQNIPQIKQLWANILGYLSPANFCTIPQ